MTHKRRQRFIVGGLTILVIGILSNHMFAQSENQTILRDPISEIYTETFVYESDSSGKGRLDIYIQVPYSEISFIKDREQYTGHIEISAAAVTKEKREIWQTSQIVELNLKNFAQTTSHRQSSLKRFSTDLEPGYYDLILQVKDTESKKITTFHKSVTVRDFRKDSLTMSDLMLVHRMDVDGTRKNIVPNLTGAIAKGANDFYFFFEIYCNPQLDSVQLLCTFTNHKNEIVTRLLKTEVLTGNRTQITWQIDTPALASDQYVILIEAVGYSKTSPAVKVHASSSRPCLVRIKDLPLTVTDIEKAIDQLQYFAQGSDITYIKEAKTPEEKQKRFLEFWAKRDPDPKTPRNELMEEYYLRVAYANRNFTHYLEGWKTDRGMVYIRFGPPENIDGQSFNVDSKPYEIWYYYDRNRKFIFVDETGFGDYRLQYFGSDLWERIR
jgi:GWxTD domain-containing protein